MDLTNTVITTERLKLVALSEKYAEDIFKEFTPEITHYMFPKSPDKIEETLDYIRGALPKIQKGEELPVVILQKDTGEFLGAGGVHKIATSKPELGIWIKKSAHGNTYGREAVTGLKKWIDEHVDYTYIVYPVDRNNVASRKIAESLGGVVEAEYPKKNGAGIVMDMVEYRIYKK